MISEYRYLLDNNALAKIPRAARASDFVRRHCRVPAEVLHEAQGYPDRAQLKELLYPTTAAVLEVLKEILASVDPGDTKLIDLYHNRGNADPILIACAVHARNERANELLTEEWIVVSDDHAVQKKAAEFQVEVLTSVEFFKRIPV